MGLFRNRSEEENTSLINRVATESNLPEVWQRFIAEGKAIVKSRRSIPKINEVCPL
jgi:hypothetical protein